MPDVPFRTWIQANRRALNVEQIYPTLNVEAQSSWKTDKPSSAETTFHTTKGKFEDSVRSKADVD